MFSTACKIKWLVVNQNQKPFGGKGRRFVLVRTENFCIKSEEGEEGFPHSAAEDILV